MPSINFRPADDHQHERLAAAAKNKGRPIAVEMRAAIDIYLDLIELAHTRAVFPVPGQERAVADLQEKLANEIGRTLLPSLTDIARHEFESAAGVEYSEASFERVQIPFERVLQWVATGQTS